MEKDYLVEQIGYLCNEMLNIDCPYMSGNMQDHISMRPLSDGSFRITISAPKYDVALWERTSQIRYTNEGHYANDVNNYGGFFTFNKSRHWVNRAVFKACSIIADQNKGKVILYNVEL